jgi:hypothetical protein
MKFPAATSAVFFFDVGRAKNCSFHTFPVIAGLRLDTAAGQLHQSLGAALASYESDPVRFRSAASGWVVIPAVGHRFLSDGDNGSER